MRPASLLRTLQLLGLNAVPAAGYFGAQWSASTMLLLYWSESILIAALIAVRIVLHRRATHKRGHYRRLQGKGRSEGGSLLTGHLAVAIPFNLGHGVFLFVIVFLLLPQIAGKEAVGVDLLDLRAGLAGIAVLLLVGFLIDLIGLGKRSFRWLEKIVQRSLGRVVVVHLSIIFGMVAMAFIEAPRTFFAVFVAFKTLSDLTWMLPQSEPTSQPPAWLGWVNRLDKTGNGETFAEYWRRTHEAEVRTREENEQMVEPAR